MSKVNLLDSSVQELYQKEPFWNICNPCQCEGCCCIGADVSVYEDEWRLICDYVQTLPAEERNVLADNIKINRMCIFRATDKCLIHPVRPENCRYTPYQYVVTSDDHLRYSQVKISGLTSKCVFKAVDEPIDPSLAHELRQNKFADLLNHGRHTKYLSLNWQVAYSPLPGSHHPVSEWIRIEPLIY